MNKLKQALKELAMTTRFAGTNHPRNYSNAFDVVVKEIGRLENELEKYKWQPIETAPVDGTEFDAWHPVYGRTPRCIKCPQFETIFAWEPETGLFTQSFSVSYPDYPTHWMPIPQPPKED